MKSSWTELLSLVAHAAVVAGFAPCFSSGCIAQSGAEPIDQFSGAVQRPAQMVRGVDQPAEPGEWWTAGSVFEGTGLYPKFHTRHGTDWFRLYRHPSFNPVRILFNNEGSKGETSQATALAIYNETASAASEYYQAGARDFIVLNEPNIEGWPNLWSSAEEFGIVFKELCRLYSETFPSIHLWFPGLSPSSSGGYGPPQDEFIARALSAAWGKESFGEVYDAFDGAPPFYGVAMHAYTDRVWEGQEQNAVNDLISKVYSFRSRHQWRYGPLLIGEFSVNRPGPSEYKAKVYKMFYEELSSIGNVFGAYSFTASWGPTDDANQEGWFPNGIHSEYKRLIGFE
ncbi:MAG: hypothetical protein IPJ88_06785 [Myxococcales bacterium]|nr:MAG: hypothetical protein IPJ88_06785 [Myxococcales bacterium]